MTTIEDIVVCDLSARVYRAPNATSLAIVAHPYGPLGGSQDDPVVTLLARTLQRQNVLTYTFNFSRFPWHTRHRREFKTLMTWCLSTHQQVERLFLCGYSYGTLCFPDPPPSVPTKHVVVSPVLGWTTFLTQSFKDPYVGVKQRDALIVYGAHDQFSDSGKLDREFNGVQCDTDHFWGSKAARDQLVTLLDDFVKS